MNKEEALSLLKCFKSDGISRDKMIELYNFFRYNPEENSYTLTLTGGESVLIKRTELWNVVNTSDIREIYKKSVPHSEIDINEENITSTDFTKLRKETISYKTKLNAERNNFNKKLKDISQIEDFEQEIIRYLKKLKPITQECNNIVTNSNNDDVLVVQLSDLHINELTNEFGQIGYDICVANKRLKKFANKIKSEITSNKIKKVVMAMTGDLINSDSILSKQQNNATDKATSTLLATKLLQYFLLDVYSVCQNIVVVGVVGNEGRYSNSDNFYTDENLIVNSPDALIFNFLEILFEDFKSIKFINGRKAEQVVNINGQNILFTHGNLFKGDTGKSVAQTFARYSSNGVNLRFVIFGHQHATKISNFFMRSSSLVGNNAYATTMLNVNSLASQNICYISKNGDINAMAIDLQNVDNMNGYNIDSELNKFNVKKSQKNNNFDVIEKV